MRQVEKMRVERLHWIIPTLQEQVKRTTYRKDALGKDLKDGFIPEQLYRIYWIPKYEYLVVLNHDKGNTALSLNTAYRVTEPETREWLLKLFPKPNAKKYPMNYKPIG